MGDVFGRLIARTNEGEHLFVFHGDLHGVRSRASWRTAVSSPMNCLPKRTVLCTMGRHRIEEGMSLQRALPCKPEQGCRMKTPLFGEATTPCPKRSKGSKFYGRQWAKLSLFGTIWFRRLRNTLCCSPVFPRFWTFRQHGFSSCAVPQRSPIFSSGQWHQISQRSMHCTRSSDVVLLWADSTLRRAQHPCTRTDDCASWADAMAVIDGKPRLQTSSLQHLSLMKHPGVLENSNNRSARPWWFCWSAKLARASDLVHQPQQIMNLVSGRVLLPRISIALRP